MDPSQHLRVLLGLVIWRTLQQWMKGCGFGTAPGKLLEHMAEVRSIDVVLPTDACTELRLQAVSKPDKNLAILPDKLQLLLPNNPRTT